MSETVKRPVISAVRYSLAHTPGLVRHGSRPSRDIAKDPVVGRDIESHLRSYEEAAAYPPNRAFLGSLYPDQLREIEQPWFRTSSPAERHNPHGEIMPEEEFYGLLKLCDGFDLVWLEEEFCSRVGASLKQHSQFGPGQFGPGQLGEGHPSSDIQSQLDVAGALPLYLRGGALVGCVVRAHQEDLSLTPEVLLENLACKATATMALGDLMAQNGSDTGPVEYVLNSGEEAVGDRYQRGGGNLAKAVAEMCGCVDATGCDIKGFCCGPVHALVIAASLVSAGVFRRVAVVGGCSLAKLGMKYRGHLSHDQPVLEDVLAGLAVMVSEDDGLSPVLRLDSVGKHTVGAGSSQQAVLERLVAQPLERLGLHFQDVDKYATELHNPEVTEPSASGNVPLLNYRMIGALAALRGEIQKAEIPDFIAVHGMPGFSPTQGHIASAVPFLGHALDRLKAGTMRRAMFLAKGSLFLGRMTQMSDGLSFVLERNDGV